MRAQALGGAKLAYALFFALVVFGAALQRPEHNWDMIGYVASIAAAGGLEGEALRAATYADVEASTSARKFAALTGGEGYRGRVYRDPVSLEQQLPFYRIRTLYLLLVWIASAFTSTLSHATVLVSALSGGAILLLACLALWRRGLAVFLFAPIAALSLGLLALARLSTPDALAAALALAALLLMRRRPLAGLALLVVVPLVRTDFVLLSFLLVFLVERPARDWRHYALAGAAVVPCVLTNLLAANYGYLAVFNFTFIDNPLKAYPADMVPSSDAGDYLQAYLRGLSRVAENKLVFLYAFAAALAAVSCKGSAPPFWNRAALLTIAFALLHFGLFPAGFERFYFLATLVAALFLLTYLDGRLAAAREAGLRPGL